jgi:hypothetical protein
LSSPSASAVRAASGSDELGIGNPEAHCQEQLEGLVDIVGAFCMDACSKGVSVMVGDRGFSGIRPEDADAFFYREIYPHVSDHEIVRSRS